MLELHAVSSHCYLDEYADVDTDVVVVEKPTAT